ncbi:MAG TPA: YoaK family protein [Burkholderiaceae bacterium]|nr:YoaK family protein [Burkholderiaceae bacterium]
MGPPVIPARLTGLLGFNAGYVDTAGFLALNGLFTAHVTGNFVTLGASLVHGTSGALAKLLALPLFCLVVLCARLAGSRMLARGRAPVTALLMAKVIALVAAAGVLIVRGPFADGNGWPAFSAGMLLVAAMAIQNAVQRMYMASAPPSTLMTGTTTQVMIDLADLLGGVVGEVRQAAIGRLRKMIPALVAFAAGCALAALGYVAMGMWCFALPPLIAVLTVMTSRER